MSSYIAVSVPSCFELSIVDLIQLLYDLEESLCEKWLLWSLTQQRVEGTLHCVMEAIVVVATKVLVRKLKADRKNEKASVSNYWYSQLFLSI